MISIMGMLKLILPSSFINKLKHKYNIPDMDWSLKNLHNNGFRPTVILDIGAYEGEWTKMVSSIFPDARILMFEAQESKHTLLASLNSAKIDHHIGLLGSEVNSKSKFYINDTVSSALPESEKEKQDYVEVAMFTVDEVLKTKGFTKADFIKLDVQGFELEVLKGATVTLQSAEVVLMEVSLIEINKGAPLIFEVMKFMNQQDFVCYDICSLVRRPLDNALWQTDLIFVKNNSKLIASKKYE